MRIVVIGGFRDPSVRTITGRRAPLADRRPLRIEPGTGLRGVDRAMERLGIELRLDLRPAKVPIPDDRPLELTFRSLADFDVASLASRAAAADAFHDLDFATQALDDPETSVGLQMHYGAPGSAVPARPFAEAPASGETVELDASDPTHPMIRGLRAQILAERERRIRSVLHHAAFRDLERAWRSLAALVEGLPNPATHPDRGPTLVHLLDVSRSELEVDLTASRPDLLDVLQESASGAGQPWDAIVWLDRLDRTVADAGLARRLETLAEALGETTRLFVGARPKVLAPDAPDESLDAAWADIPTACPRLTFSSETFRTREIARSVQVEGVEFDEWPEVGPRLEPRGEPAVPAALTWLASS